jgi:RNA polymerase sigma-70 factor (ECF subfamily)
LSYLNDGQLVLRLQQGDLDALGILYDRHRQMVYRTALVITGDTEEASDLLQDVFLRLHRFSHRIDPLRPLEPWLYRMTSNLAYTWIKRRHRWLRCLKEMGEWLTRERKPTPHIQVERDEEWRLVQQAVASLPVSQRVVVVLYYALDFSSQEISEILDVPVGTVKSRLFYGRRTLKRQLGLHREKLPEEIYEFT